MPLPLGHVTIGLTTYELFSENHLLPTKMDRIPFVNVHFLNRKKGQFLALEMSNFVLRSKKDPEYYLDSVIKSKYSEQKVLWHNLCW